MTEADDLIEKLLAMYSHRCDGLPTQYVNPDGPDAAARIATQQEALREARKWIAGQPDRSTSIYSTSFAMLEAIDATLNGEKKDG